MCCARYRNISRKVYLNISHNRANLYVINIYSISMMDKCVVGMMEATGT